jgi:hypothetical protein
MGQLGNMHSRLHGGVGHTCALSGPAMGATSQVEALRPCDSCQVYNSTAEQSAASLRARGSGHCKEST